MLWMDSREYTRIHHWLRYHHGSADHCEALDCLGTSKTFEWAKKKGREYAKNRENFIQLCQPCHFKYDGRTPAKPKMKKKKEQRELATVNIRIYESTRDAISEEARLQGKTMARILDEKFNPQKYEAKQ